MIYATTYSCYFIHYYEQFIMNISKTNKKTTTIPDHRMKLQLANATVPTQIISNWLTLI